MIKKTLATVAVAASAFGMASFVATPALAVGGDDESGTNTVNGNGSKKAYGNTTTGGYMSPNLSLVNGSLNDVCVVADDIDVQNVVQVLAIPIGLQDLLNSKPHANCTENTTVSDNGDDPLSHLLSDLSLLSENGVSEH